MKIGNENDRGGIWWNFKSIEVGCINQNLREMNENKFIYLFIFSFISLYHDLISSIHLDFMMYFQCSKLKIR